MAPFPPGQERTYGVAWVCPGCGDRSLDVCPLGPVIPTATTCLNCGEERAIGTDCTGCGMSDDAVIAFLGIANEENPAAEIHRGLVRRGLGRVNRTLRDDPANADAWQQKGYVYSDLGFHDAMLLMLRHAAKAASAPLFLFSAGLVMQRVGRHDDAVAAYRELIDVAPTRHEVGMALNNIGNSLSALRRNDEAEDAYRQSIERDPRRATLYFNCHIHYRKRGQWPQAIAVLERGYPHAGDDAQRVSFLVALALGHAECDRGAEALEAAERALELDERSIAARYLRGRALGMVGQLAEALAEMEQVLAADPEHADAKNAIVLLKNAGAKRPWWRIWS
jgi:tetratricopeptide (TPR) repeat protein